MIAKSVQLSFGKRLRTVSGGTNADEGGSDEVAPGTGEGGHGDIGSHGDESAGAMLEPRELARFRACQAHAEEFAACQANQALPRRRQASLSYEEERSKRRGLYLGSSETLEANIIHTYSYLVGSCTPSGTKY